MFSLQYAALATQIGTAALLEAPRRGTRPVGPNITKPRAAEQHQHVAAAPADAGLRRVASSPALLAMVQHGAAAGRVDCEAELAELWHEIAELRGEVEDLELKVRSVTIRSRMCRTQDDRRHRWRVRSAWSGVRWPVAHGYADAGA